jgi:pilus assembly protein Flp/PilA
MIYGWWQQQVARRMEGQSLVEYALILVLIAIVVLAVVTVIGHRASNLFSNVSTALGQ